MTADRITVAELQELLAAGQPVTVLDVRSPSDVDWEIPGSIHVDASGDLRSGRLGPLAELNLPPGPVITVRVAGRTGATATDLLVFGSTALLAMPTPGHTAESTTYLLDDTAALTGDTLFLNSVGRPDLEGGTRQERASRARLLHMSVSRLLQLPEATQVFPGHVSEATPFDGRMLRTTVGTIRDTVALARLEEAAFAQAVLARIPPNPPNHSRIVEFNA